MEGIDLVALYYAHVRAAAVVLGLLMAAHTLLALLTAYVLYRAYAHMRQERSQGANSTIRAVAVASAQGVVP